MLTSADIFLVLNASTVDLPAVEQFYEAKVGKRPLVLWNLELDTLRAGQVVVCPPRSCPLGLCRVTGFWDLASMTQRNPRSPPIMVPNHTAF